MPSFTDTLMAHVNAVDSIESIKSIIEGTYPLGVSGYTVQIDSHLSQKNPVRVTIVGKDLNINKVPRKALKNYLTVRNEVNQWVKGALPDFPDFTDRF